MLKAPENTHAVVSYNDGRRVASDTSGKLTILFDDEWQHETPVLWGVDIDKVLIEDVKVNEI
jgi:hypothetical protein